MTCVFSVRVIVAVFLSLLFAQYDEISDILSLLFLLFLPPSSSSLADDDDKRQRVESSADPLLTPTVKSQTPHCCSGSRREQSVNKHHSAPSVSRQVFHTFTYCE